MNDVIEALESDGVPGLMVIDAWVLGNWIDPDRTKLSMKYCDMYYSSVEPELICEEKDVERFIRKIFDAAYTGKK